MATAYVSEVDAEFSDMIHVNRYTSCRLQVPIPHSAAIAGTANR